MRKKRIKTIFKVTNEVTNGEFRNKNRQYIYYSVIDVLHIIVL